MKPSESAFLEFGLLPGVCIHSIIEDRYSKMYVARTICQCGCSEWVDSSIEIIRDLMGYEYPKKQMHRCKQCNQVRMADHISVSQGNGEL